MKIKDGYALRSVGSQHVVVATGSAVGTFKKLIRLNATGAELWEPLSHDHCTRDDLVRVLIDTYGIDSNEAARDVDDFINEMERADLVEHDEP